MLQGMKEPHRKGISESILVSSVEAALFGTAWLLLFREGQLALDFEGPGYDRHTGMRLSAAYRD